MVAALVGMYSSSSLSKDNKYHKKRRRASIKWPHVVSRVLVVLIGVALLLQLWLHFDLIDVRENYQHGDVGVGGAAVSVESALAIPIDGGETLTQEEMSFPEEEFEINILDTLTKAGIRLSPEAEAMLPSSQEVQEMYGPRPVIYGLDQCETFRNALLKPSDRMVAPAGIFNTGTNLLSTIVRRNCKLPDTDDDEVWHMRFQAPWGKHNPPSFRNKNVAPQGGVGINQTNVLPVIVIRDPISWMYSMCGHPYAANWKHSKTFCPKLFVSNNPSPNYHETPPLNPVRVRYAMNVTGTYESLVGLWNEWYREWMEEVDFPFLMMRFEDLLFHPVPVVRSICNCVGGKPKQKEFWYNANSAKGEIGPHTGGSGLFQSIVRYGNSTFRKTVLSPAEKVYAKNALRKDLMTIFQYDTELHF